MLSFSSCVILNVVNTVGLKAKIGKTVIIHTRKAFFLIFTCNRIEICISKFRDYKMLNPEIPGLRKWSGISALEALDMSHTIKISHMDGRRSETIFSVLVNCFIGNFELLTFSDPDYRKHSDTTDNGIQTIQE